MGIGWHGIAYARRKPKPQPDAPVLYTIRQTAEACQVTDWTVRNWIRAGKLRAVVMPSGRLRIERPELERVMRRR